LKAVPIRLVIVRMPVITHLMPIPGHGVMLILFRHTTPGQLGTDILVAITLTQTIGVTVSTVAVRVIITLQYVVVILKNGVVRNEKTARSQF